MGKAVMGIKGDGGVTMRFGSIQAPGHSLARPQIEKVLRHAGTGGDRAAEQPQRPLMEPEQAEHGAERIERLGGVADDARSGFRGRERPSGLAGDKEAFGAQDMGDRISGRKRDGPVGADDGGVGATPLQRCFGQHGPGAAIVRSAGENLRADFFRCREVTARKRASRSGCRARGISLRNRVLQPMTP